MYVLVTGGTGLIGRHLVARLLDRGDTVQVLSRQPLSALSLRKSGARVIGGDITQPRTLPHALASVETVYHVAGLVGPGILPPPYRLTNVTGTANLLAAAKAAGVTRFVHVSSVAAYTHPQFDTTEESEVGANRRRNAYAVSKAKGELLVHEAGKRGDFETVIVRPVFVYAASTDFTNARTWLQRLNRLPVAAIPAGGDFPFDVVHADDVAQLLVLCGTLPVAAGQSYNASGDEGLTFRQALDQIRPEGQRSPFIIPLPRRRTTGATFPSTRAHDELGYASQHHWNETQPIIHSKVEAGEKGDE
jgi:dihydroflavonol-4-reductase